MTAFLFSRYLFLFSYNTITELTSLAMILQFNQLPIKSSATRKTQDPALLAKNALGCAFHGKD